MTHCGLSSAIVRVMCADDEEEADTTIEQAQMVQERPSRRQLAVKHFRSSFGHACASYGVRHRTWTRLGPRSGVMPVVKGNACKIHVIDARGMIHYANPDVVSFVLSQI